MSASQSRSNKQLAAVVLALVLFAPHVADFCLLPLDLPFIKLPGLNNNNKNEQRQVKEDQNERVH